MSSELFNICYEGSSGASDIRTVYIDNILHFSLLDIFATLNRENKSLGEKNPTRHIPTLIKGQLTELEEDEYVRLPHPNPSAGLTDEVFVNQPGLNRVMGTDKSLASKKFQRWLYHDVVPSLIKHGVYPPPSDPQGSALAQMAEILAQNSRVLADTVLQQELIKKDVDLVKQDVGLVKGEVKEAKDRISKLENTNSDNEFILTVRSWFDSNHLPLSSQQESELVPWCENLSFRHNKPMTYCPSGDRYNTRFYKEIIEKAKLLIENSKG